MVDAEELVFYQEVGLEVLRDVQAHMSITVFHKHTTLAIMPILASEALLHENKKKLQ